MPPGWRPVATLRDRILESLWSRVPWAGIPPGGGQRSGLAPAQSPARCRDARRLRIQISFRTERAASVSGVERRAARDIAHGERSRGRRLRRVAVRANAVAFEL